MKNSLFLALIFFSLLACKQQTTTTNTASSSILPTSSSSCTIGKWSNSNLPLNLKISSEFLSDFNSSHMVNGLNPIEQTEKVWNNAISGKTFFSLPASTTNSTGHSSSSDFFDNEMGVYKSYTWFSDVSSNALAITQYYGYLRSDGQLGSYIDLTHADIIVNYRDYGPQFSLSGNSVSGYDLQTVLLHEMGHFLGLCHDSKHTSIMRPYYFTTQRSLFTFDITKITDLYVNNVNTLSSSSSYSTSNAISLPEGSFVRGRTELMKDGLCKHYMNGKLTYQHQTENKKGLVNNKAFHKTYSNFINNLK